MNYLELVQDEISKPLVPTAAQAVFDGALVEATSASSQYELTDLRLLVAGAMVAWVETDDLGDGETLPDRLDALMVGIVDTDKDGDISDDEADVIGLALGIADEWMRDHGVAETDIDAILNEADDEAAENVVDMLQGQLPDGDDAIQAEINEFAGLGEVLDSAVLDAVYKKKVAFRNGKRTIIKKRISGKVRLTSRQKMAIAKAQRKSHNGAARMKRAKSMIKRRKAGF